jgi:hypothetical protein
MNIKIESGANVQITDKPIYNIYGDVVQQKVIQVGDSTNKEDFPHFPLNNTNNEGIRLYKALTADGFMQGALDSWLFLLGFSDQKPLHIIPIKWLGTKEQLRVMLRMLFERLIKENALSVADIERLTPHCFVDKKDKPMQLAKPREETSMEMDQLKEIFRPSAAV